jgi:hypothetical protein
MWLLHNRTNQRTALPLYVLHLRLLTSFQSMGKMLASPEQVTEIVRGFSSVSYCSIHQIHWKSKKSDDWNSEIFQSGSKFLALFSRHTWYNRVRTVLEMNIFRAYIPERCRLLLLKGFSVKCIIKPSAPQPYFLAYQKQDICAPCFVLYFLKTDEK